MLPILPLSDPARRRFIALSIFALWSISIGVLAGYLAEIKFLQSLVPGYPIMRPITAVSFLIIGLAFAGNLRLTDRGRSALMRSVGSVLCLASAGILAAYLLELSTGIDRFVLPDRSSAAFDNTSPHSAFNFLLVGLSMLLVTGSSASQRVSSYLSLISVSGTFIIALGHLFHISDATWLISPNGMAIPTVILFTISASGLLVLNPECRPVNLLFSDTLGGHAARVLFPIVILVPTFIGFLRVVGQDFGLYGTGFGTTISVFVVVLLMFGLVVFYSQKVHAADGKRAKAEFELARRESRYRDLFDYSQSIISTHDVEGRMLSVNKTFRDSLGYESEEILGESFVKFVPEQYRSEYPAYLRKMVHEGEAKGLASMIARDGRVVAWQYHNILISESGNEPYVLGSAIDVTNLLRVQNELERTSLTDEMTGLYNRRGFLTLADQQLKLERHASTARGLTLLFADMDGLKKINDTFGHEAGSDAIRALAETLRSIFRSGDLVARWGGDEFVVLSIGADDANVKLMLDRIEERLEEYNGTSGKPYKVECSIGIAPVTLESNASFENIIAEADEAMYEVKRNRKSRREPMLMPRPALAIPSIHDSLSSC